MPVYNFKRICKVPNSTEFVDLILSKTQRKTPTVVRKGWKISRIRSFYMRKIKFTQQNYHDRLSQILDDFPQLDEIHPFYADLINVLYSRDHYKLALGQINTARQSIDNLGKDYLRLLKFGDSLYRCKELKRAALGRMCTVMKKLKSSLAYLEQVRQHLARLPSINPNTRTLMITGYPNVGKSSFINKVSRANVDVQPYAFTTKSLFVGHCNYKYLPWQVIDTPGILDHPLEARNTIEMQAITALAHLHSTVLFFVDISGTCGYSIKQQAALYHSIKPLFANKPLLVVANKIDLVKFDDLDDEDKALIEGMAQDRGTTVIQMSNATEVGIDVVKTTACDMLLEHRVKRKFNSKRINDVMGRIQITRPVARDRKARPVSIPDSVKRVKQAKKDGVAMPARRTLKDRELSEGGPGIFHFNMQEYWDLKNPEHQFDIVPEIIDGKNIADFIDPDIDQRLAELEAEEAELEARAAMEAEEEDSGLESEEEELVMAIRERKGDIREANLLKSTNNKPVMPRKHKVKRLDDVETELNSIGLSADKLRARSRKARGTKRRRDAMEEKGDGLDDSMDMGDDSGRATKRQRGRSRTRMVGDKARDQSRTRDQSKAHSFKDPTQKTHAEKLNKIMQRKMNRNARQGESDRRFMDKKPKFINSGKMGVGKKDWR